MPFINLKLLKGQVSAEQKVELVEGITDLVVELMGRDRNYTVITVDELEAGQWAVGGKMLKPDSEKIVTFLNIKVSKGTTNPVEIERMMYAVRELMSDVLGKCHETNYFIIDELNPDAWGYDGIPMTTRRRMSEQ
ncbi:MAG TPA: 2-hydroxymuconate tautomerase family protein [Clostridia bacterium]|nr:2-hydroxymuconate tautomerase family protein [Clostridia bacterium]